MLVLLRFYTRCVENHIKNKNDYNYIKRYNSMFFALISIN